MDSSAQQMVDSFLLSLTKLPPGAQDTVNQALEGMGLKIDDGVGLMYTGGDKDGQAFIEGWNSKDASYRQMGSDAVSTAQTGATSAGNVKTGFEVTGAAEAARIAVGVAQAAITGACLVMSAMVSGGKQWKGGYFSNGGVTGYANGGYQINKHADGAVGVFTHRTRLWDPVTGVNEYGEKGHEALLPLKQSVYNEIAKGIVRQFSPAKLSGVITAMRESVRSESANTSAAVVGAADYYRSPSRGPESSTPNVSSNDTFNFYEPVETPQAHARAVRRAKRELAYD
jgi:hypothetical protein